MGFWIKYLDDDTYSECGFNKDGNLYIIEKVEVQRGMGHQKANEVLILGMNRKQILPFLKRNNAVIVSRSEPPEAKNIKTTFCK